LSFKNIDTVISSHTVSLHFNKAEVAFVAYFQMFPYGVDYPLYFKLRYYNVEVLLVA
jgi:hypothetical protein